MTSLTIGVLGPVEMLHDGRPVPLFRQEAIALAVLVAARGRPVSREVLAAAIWPDGSEPAGDGLATIMSRLRGKLLPDGPAIPSARGSAGYRLAGQGAGDLSGVVDAAEFEASAAAGHALLADGRTAEALGRFRAAAARWRGTPLDVGGRPWPQPRLCAAFAADLDARRADLVAAVARAALRTARYDDASFLAGQPVAAGLEGSDALWLLTFLRSLRDDGIPAAERAIESRQQRGGYAQVVDRALDLLALARAGIDVHGDLGRAPREPAAAPPVPASLAALRDRVAAGQPAIAAISGPAGAGKSALAGAFAGSLAGSGIEVATMSCQSHGELHPWRALAGALWAAALRDLSGPPGQPTKAEQHALADFVTGLPDRPSAAPAHQRDLLDLASALAGLLRTASAGRGLIVVFDDADLLSARGCELLGAVRDRLAGAAVGWLLAGRAEGPWTEGTVLGRDALPALTLPGARAGQRPEDVGTRPGAAAEPTARWLAAAALTATAAEVDAPLVAGMLGLDDDAADRLRAAAMRCAPLAAGTSLTFTDAGWLAKLIAEVNQDPVLARSLHRQAFDVLQERARRSWPDPGLPARIAGHALAADRDVSDQDAAAACLDAARAEQARGDASAAAGWAKAGLRRRCRLATRFGLLLALGDAQNERGEMSAAGNQYLEAYEQAAGRPRLQAVAVIHMARRWSDPGQTDDDLLHLIESCLAALAGDGDPEARALRLRLSAHLAHKSTMAVPDQGGGRPGGAGPRGPGLARLALAGLTPDIPAMAACEVLNECRWGLYDHAPPAETLAISERFRAESLRTRSAFFRSEALVALAIDQLRTGPVSRAQDTIAKHRSYVAAHQRPLGAWLQGTLDTLADLWHGRFAAAQDRLFGPSLQAMQEAKDARVPPADTLLQTWQAQVYWLLHELGRMSEVVGSPMADDISEHGYFPIWRAAWILACCDTGRFDEAADRLPALLADTADLTALPPHGWAVPMLALLAESCAILASAGRCDVLPDGLVERLAAQLAPHDGEIVLAGWPAALLGPACRFRGLLALAAGDHEAALGHFDRALPVVGDARPQVARLRLDRARALAASGTAAGRESAAALAAQARDQAGQLGMAWVAARADALAADLAG